MKTISAAALMTCAGLATAGSPNQSHVDLDLEYCPIADAYIEDDSWVVDEDIIGGYYYLNLATNELIFNRAAPVASPVRGASTEVWIADNNLPCADFGQTSGSVHLIDNIGSSSDWATGSLVIDWGDVPADTVVDAVQLRYSSRHEDTPDADGNPSGVIGFGAEWSWNDGDNGRNSCLTRTPLVSMTMFNLPGSLNPGSRTTYTFTVDLADSGISFEIGDSDGDPQGADVHNPFFFITDTSGDGFPDGDLDGDGLADFSFGQRFFQPGTVDWTGDGNLDGDLSAWADVGNTLVAPRGTPVPRPDNPARWDMVDIDPLPAGQGMEDGHDRYIFPFGDDFAVYAGTRFFSGFSCDRDGDGSFARRNSFSQYWTTLLGPGGDPGCPVDLNGDGQVNFFDVSLFIAAFNAGDDLADWNNDGLINFFDIQLFINDFNAGCP
ncbi:MAG: dockerin type I domain-containing protein [Phycisphaerales bacterium]|nr:hypothetical protein [Planctomycetota bacterium]MCH8509596.1 dockerin type I domain-containing protein [Phycisphaerales bacterium]